MGLDLVLVLGLMVVSFVLGWISRGRDARAPEPPAPTGEPEPSAPEPPDPSPLEAAADGDAAAVERALTTVEARVDGLEAAANALFGLERALAHGSPAEVEHWRER